MLVIVQAKPEQQLEGWARAGTRKGVQPAEDWWRAGRLCRHEPGWGNKRLAKLSAALFQSRSPMVSQALSLCSWECFGHDAIPWLEIEWG